MISHMPPAAASTAPLRGSGKREANRNLLLLGFVQVPSVNNPPITAGTRGNKTSSSQVWQRQQKLLSVG